MLVLERFFGKYWSLQFGEALVFEITTRTKKKNCEFCKAEYIFKRKEKEFAKFDFDSTILNANFLYVRLDKDNVSISNSAERGEVQGGKSPSSLNLV